MSVAPFFPFFSSDWRSGTLGMPYELKGFYIDILALIWDRQSRLPEDHKEIAVWLQIDPRKVKRLINCLIDADKLYKEDGWISNRRMDRLLDEHSERSEAAQAREVTKRLLGKVTSDFGETSTSTSTSTSTQTSSEKSKQKSPKKKSKNSIKSKGRGPHNHNHIHNHIQKDPLTPYEQTELIISRRAAY